MKKTAIKLLGGGAVGVANGLFGGGGGMIAVPILRAAGLDTLASHATAIAVILPASVVSGAVYLFSGLVPLGLLLPVGLGVLLGGFAGARILRRAAPAPITLIFALFMFAAGVRMLF